MNTIEKLKAKTLELRKARNPLGPVMQFHMAEVAKIGKSNSNRDTTEQEAIQYLKKTVQKLKENEFSNSEEIVVLEDMLPQMVSYDEVHKFILEKDLDVTNRGAVMKAVREHFGALVDMKMVAEIIQ